MSSAPNVVTNDGEAFEIVTLSRLKRIADEVWDDAPEEILEPSGFPLHRSIAAIGTNASASEVRGDRVNDFGPVSVLADREAWPHFPSRGELRSRRDGNCEATFSVDVAGDVGREELATVARAGV
jgi:hypothetical protein